MSRISPFPIILSSEEETLSQTLARQYTSPYYKVIRAQTILLAAQGWENKDIGDHLDLPRQMVCKWRKRFFEERLAGLQDRPRRGRPRVFSPGGDRGDQSPGL